MANQWQTFVRKFNDVEEGERELFIKDLRPGAQKYDTRHVRAKITRSRDVLPGGDLLWIRSESGLRATEPWYMKILEELPESVAGRPWENVLDAIGKKERENPPR